MANLIRSAKIGSDWTEYELAAYNITVVCQTKAEFFGVNDLPDSEYCYIAGHRIAIFLTKTLDLLPSPSIWLSI